VRTCPTCGTRYSDPIAYCPNDGTRTTLVPESVVPADPFVGQTIDARYHIEARIGEGGMGVVYRATHVVLKKNLAIKVMRGEQANDPDVVQRFVQEARASSAIGHPNIVSISDFGTTADGAVYFAMEYLQGQTLGEAMVKGRLARDRALSIFIQMASALEAAHAVGIIHRDLKPDNIFLTREPEHEDFVKVLDFGIAKVRNAAAKITRTGMVFGTPHYMSPEQAAGQTVDHRSDIYSMGVIMYQVFAGQLPFDSESYMDVMTKHMYEAPPLPSGLRPDLRGPIENIIMKALQKKTELRYATMLRLREDLERVQSGQSDVGLVLEPARAYTPSSGTEASLPRIDTGAQSASVDYDSVPVSVPKRKSSTWLLVAIGVLLLGLGAAWLGSGNSADKPASAAPTGAAGAPPPTAAGHEAIRAAEPAPPPAAVPALEAPPQAEPAEKKTRAKPAPVTQPERPRRTPKRAPEAPSPWQ
jgi:serine/threonine-protein kinase